MNAREPGELVVVDLEHVRSIAMAIVVARRRYADGRPQGVVMVVEAPGTVGWLHVCWLRPTG